MAKIHNQPEIRLAQKSPRVARTNNWPSQNNTLKLTELFSCISPRHSVQSPVSPHSGMTKNRGPKGENSNYPLAKVNRRFQPPCSPTPSFRANRAFPQFPLRGPSRLRVLRVELLFPRSDSCNPAPNSPPPSINPYSRSERGISRASRGIARSARGGEEAGRSAFHTLCPSQFPPLISTVAALPRAFLTLT
jgi:hypothetical protein